MTRRATMLTLVFPVMTWAAGGFIGLLVGLLIVTAWWVLSLRPGAFWVLALLALCAAPVAMIARGLPRTPVVGPGFGKQHILAHYLVGLAMAFATFAALVELLGLESKGNRILIQLQKLLASAQNRVPSATTSQPPPGGVDTDSEAARTADSD